MYTSTYIRKGCFLRLQIQWYPICVSAPSMWTNLRRHTLASNHLHQNYSILGLLLLLLATSMLLVHPMCYILLCKPQLHLLFWMPKKTDLIEKTKVLIEPKFYMVKAPVLILGYTCWLGFSPLSSPKPSKTIQNLDISPRHTGPLLFERSSAFAIAASVSATNCGACAWAMTKLGELAMIIVQGASKRTWQWWMIR